MSRVRYIQCVVAALALTGCLSHASRLPEWTAKGLSPNDRLLCAKSKNGEEFFVAISGNRAKLGYQLDMTAYNDTHAFIAGWVLRDEAGESLVAQVPPEDLSGGYETSEGRTYATSIQYQVLSKVDFKVINASLSIKKCATRRCDRTQKLSDSEVEYVVPVCQSQPNK